MSEQKQTPSAWALATALLDVPEALDATVARAVEVMRADTLHGPALVNAEQEIAALRARLAEAERCANEVIASLTSKLDDARADLARVEGERDEAQRRLGNRAFEAIAASDEVAATRAERDAALQRAEAAEKRDRVLREYAETWAKVSCACPDVQWRDGVCDCASCGARRALALLADAAGDATTNTKENER